MIRLQNINLTSPEAIQRLANNHAIAVNLRDAFPYPYGAFIEFLPGKDGLLHISEIDWKRLETVEEAGIKEGDEIEVKLIDIDPKTGKFKLSRKVLMPRPEKK